MGYKRTLMITAVAVCAFHPTVPVGVTPAETAWRDPNLHEMLAPPAQAAYRCGDSDSDQSACAIYAPGTDEAYIWMFENLMRAAGPNAYSAGSRWTLTATDGTVAARGTPVTLTYSFVPDFNTGDPATSNFLHQTLDAQFGSRDAWRSVFQTMFDDWSALTGITFVEESDDGAAWPSSVGVVGVRGDIRIVCQQIDGPDNVLAFNFFPTTGDMSIDLDENWAIPANNFRFMRNVLMHELGHGIGLGHVLPRDGTKLLEAFLSLGFDGPQDDDARGANYNYGDPREPNNTVANANDLGVVSAVSTFYDLSLHDTADADWFQVAATGGAPISVEATPVGASYSVSDDPGAPVQIDTRAILRLRVEIFGENGQNVLASATAGAAGATAATGQAALPDGHSTFRVRISTPDAVNDVQRYSLKITPNSGPVLLVQSSPISGVTIAVSPTDDNGASDGGTPLARFYAANTATTLTAPQIYGDYTFDRWLVDNVEHPADQLTLNLTVPSGGATAVARYINSGALLADAGPGNVIEAGQSLQLSGSASGGDPPYSFAWTPSGTLSDAAIPNPVATPGVTTQYQLVVTDSQARVASDSLMVTVLPALTVEAGQNISIEPGGQFTLTGGASGGLSPYFYFWSPTAGLVTPHSRTTAGSATETTTFMLSVTDSTGKLASDRVTVSVYSMLSVSAGADQVISAGASATLSATPSGGLGPYFHTWTPTASLVNSDGSVVSVSPSETTVYQVTTRDALGQSAVDAVRVDVLPALSVSATPTATINPGGSHTLDAEATGGVPPYSYAWSPTTGLQDPGAVQTLCEPSQTTRYTLTVTDSSGQSAQIYVEVIVSQNLSGGEPAPVVNPCGGGVLGMTPILLAFLAPMKYAALRRRRRRTAPRPPRLSA